jgi:GT2 family glycosyltransferase
MKESVSVVVPTYGRPDALSRCLESLNHQRRPADEVVVVCRQGDTKSSRVARKLAPAREVTVDQPGYAPALAAGLRAARGEILAIGDDDAVFPPDWLERLLSHLGDPRVGAVCGRDVWAGSIRPTRPRTEDVGRITPWGKLVGNHYLGVGQARDVMVVQAVGALRRAAVAVPHGLRPRASPAHSEVSVSLWARRQGWRLVYDPEIVVHHYKEFAARSTPTFDVVRDTAFNLVVSICVLEPSLRRRRAAFGLVVGDRESPGIGRALVGLVRGEIDVVRRLPASLVGQVEGLRAAARGDLEMIPLTHATQPVP